MLITFISEYIHKCRNHKIKFIILINYIQFISIDCIAPASYVVNLIKTTESNDLIEENIFLTHKFN